jgi:hypothetical protein
MKPIKLMVMADLWLKVIYSFREIEMRLIQEYIINSTRYILKQWINCYGVLRHDVKFYNNI